MPQGKLKIKAKLPPSVAAKKKQKQKGPSATTRPNKPQQPKISAVQRLKNDTLKRIHKSTEEEMRQKALDGKAHLGKKKRPAPTEEPDEEDADSSSESPAKKRKT